VRNFLICILLKLESQLLKGNSIKAKLFPQIDLKKIKWYLFSGEKITASIASAVSAQLATQKAEHRRANISEDRLIHILQSP
jgi:hypothetical protein